MGYGKANRALISIHAPHAGSDALEAAGYTVIEISIHAPHAGSDSENYQQSMSLLIVFSKKQ